MNTIHVNYMTRTFGHFLQNGSSGIRAEASTANVDGMAHAIVEAAKRRAAQGNAAQTAGSADIQDVEIGIRELQPFDRSVIEAMTMDEYKEYIKRRILALPMHSSHMQDTISVSISDEGFAAMKKDADYENWVLNDLRAAWTQENPWARFMGGTYSIIYYGAAKEECHAGMWNAGFRHGNGKSMLENMSGDDDKDDNKRKSEIVVKPDGTRYLVISEVISGMKVTVMSIKLSDPEELSKDEADIGPDMPAQLLAKDSIPSAQ